MIFIMFLTMMTGLLAYEPKKECFDVYKNSVHYFEKTESDGNLLFNEYEYIRFATFKFSELEEGAVKYYNRLVWFRNTVEYFTKEKEKLSFNTKEERKLYIELDQLIEKYINTAVYEIPFITRKNFYKITEKKYKKMLIKYIKSIKK